MRKIKLVAEPAYSYKCEFNIIDVTDGPEKRRGAITVDYGVPEIRDLQAENMDFEGAIEYYRNRIYGLVKVLISDDWEALEGMQEAIDIVSKYIKEYFDGE
ncbi:MAG: hypothetical protein PUB09_00175 [Firmicutes bacterium]|nr:hypothetical protein [Bacillota bacterium]